MLQPAGRCINVGVTHFVAANVFDIKSEDPATSDASALIDELSETLANITGDSGKSSFEREDVRGPMAQFVVARTQEGVAVGCGAFRPLGEGIAELKRMYAKPGTCGVGHAVLAHLEREAAEIGYQQLWLETRLVNERAIAFYERHGYRRIPNFGKYSGNEEAACFAKSLPHAMRQNI
jgi:GNAT superfamily N-acetyltransferase